MESSPPTGESRLRASIRTAPVIPVIVLQRAADAAPVAEALLAGGISIFEITLRTSASLPAVERLAGLFPAALAGAGTVLNKIQAKEAVSAGAQFLVSPGLDEGVVEFARTNDIPVIPGVATATEAQRAFNLGLRLLKFFPAGAAGGVEMLKSCAAVFPEAEFVPTGGVSAGNLADYLRLANVVACGGSWLTPGDSIAEGRFDVVTRLALEARAIAEQVGAEAGS